MSVKEWICRDYTEQTIFTYGIMTDCKYWAPGGGEGQADPHPMNRKLQEDHRPRVACKRQQAVFPPV